MNKCSFIYAFNDTIPSVSVAISAIHSISGPQAFLAPTEQGTMALCRTKGNRNLHLILNGTNKGPNDNAKYINKAAVLFEKEHSQMHASIMVDCSRTFSFLSAFLLPVLNIHTN